MRRGGEPRARAVVSKCSAAGGWAGACGSLSSTNSCGGRSLVDPERDAQRVVVLAQLGVDAVGYLQHRRVVGLGQVAAARHKVQAGAVLGGGQGGGKVREC